MVRTLFKKANTICDQEFRKDEFNHVQEVYYKIDTLKNACSNVKQKILNRTNVNDINNGTPALMNPVALYIKNVSERVARILKQFKIHLSHMPSCKIRNKLCNFKDNRDPPNQAVLFIK